MGSMAIAAAMGWGVLSQVVGGPSTTGTVFIHQTVVAMPGTHFAAAATDGADVFMGSGQSIVVLDLEVDPPAVRPIGSIGADITALAVDRDRLWAGDAHGRLHAFDRPAPDTLVRERRIDLLPSEGSPHPVTRIAIDGARAFVAVASTGLSIVDSVGDDLSLRASIGQWNMEPQLGAIDGTVYAWMEGRFSLVDPREPGPPIRRDAVLAFDPDEVHHNFWAPKLFTVDPVNRQLVAVGGVAGWAGRPKSPCFAIAFGLAEPLTPKEIGRSYCHYNDEHHLVAGTEWVYLVSSSYWPGGSNPTMALTAFERHGGLQRPQEWWRGSEGVGIPAPLPDGRVVVPLTQGGFMVLTPYVGGRVWLPLAVSSERVSS
ncbi:MAG: hypothetical protein IT332_04345 [Ardenticatenales bacterium]|nr:hypothetical protein [Ardenticatenales bacterium]